MLKKLRWSLSAASLALLASCTPSPPDVYVFEYLSYHMETDPKDGHFLIVPSPTCTKQIKESECGHGVSIVSGKEIFVGEGKSTWFKGKPWSQLKRESIYVPAVESYAPLSAYIIDACAHMNCNDQVDAFKVKLNSLNGVSDAVSNSLKNR